ncbi:MAG: UDP-N-acetylmuramate--L-alanine ligase [Alphaproteobacteria bacterium]|nr:UDP-N-acetylmuramate--L-alanine ligase [Alphaproteobacteria bacterium]
MQTMPLDIGVIHFVGIGGIGMSGIAEVMHNLGYQVQGSDIAQNANVDRLRGLGVKVEIGHRAENLGDARVIVTSTAVKTENPEVMAARKAMLPVVRRAEMLAELMRLKWSIAVGGTHGKTTTTSLIASILETAELDPTVINGGIINAYGTNARLGSGDWMVVEADESDGSFNRLPATIAVVTNIDPEHLDFWGDFTKVKAGFRAFVEAIPFYGFATLCIDHPEVQSLLPQLQDRKLLTYGLSPAAMVRGLNVVLDGTGVRFDAAISDRITGGDRTIKELKLAMFGHHNVLNALAAVSVSAEMGIADDIIREGLARFKGVKRRFTKVGEVEGVTVIDDYGHHPVEIAAVLKAARTASTGRVVAVVQPHRYSRLQSLFKEFCTCFNDADHVVVAEVYPAGEAPIPGISRDSLINGLHTHGHPNVTALLSPKHLAAVIDDIARPGDFVVCLGAGNITAWAAALPQELAAIRKNKNGVPRKTGTDA